MVRQAKYFLKLQKSNEEVNFISLHFTSSIHYVSCKINSKLATSLACIAICLVTKLEKAGLGKREETCAFGKEFNILLEALSLSLSLLHNISLDEEFTATYRAMYSEKR